MAACAMIVIHRTSLETVTRRGPDTAPRADEIARFLAGADR